MAYESVWEQLGKQILEGKKIGELTLKGKVYKFSYTKDEFMDRALQSGWDDEYEILGKRVTLEDLANRYVATQSDFISDFSSDFCLNSGGYGCIAGDTKITTPGGEVTIEDLYYGNIAPLVYSRVGNQTQLARATVPVKYPKAQLYEVVYGDNKITATAKHRFLTPSGWKQLSDLSVGEPLVGYVPSPQESIADNGLSVLLAGVFRWLKRVVDSLTDYRHEHRSYGALLPMEEDTYPKTPPVPVGVLEHTHLNYNTGAHFSLGEHNRVYLSSYHPSRSDSYRPWRSLLASDVVSYISVKVFARASALVRWPLRFLWNTVVGLCTVLVTLGSNLWSFVFVRADSYPPVYHTITSITPTKVDNYYDLHVFGTHNYLAEGVFHHNSGKSLALYVKLTLFCKCFPGNRILLGRKTMADIDRAVLPELFDLWPPSWYEHRVKDGLINFSNGSQIILFGLDAMQSGGVADIKKAQQKLKSLNLGAYFIDQLEEVEYDVIEVLNSRLRRTSVPFRQGNMDSNPANFWAYHQYKLQQKWDGENWQDGGKGSELYETSMLYNPHLPGDYIRKQLQMGDDYVRRFVLGEWSTDLLLHGTVFSKETMGWLSSMVRSPISNEEGCEIYELPKPNVTYQMGVDPSEGAVDPSSISVVSSEGRKVAKFNGKLPINGLADKVKFLYYKYQRPRIVPESNSSGTALIREIRDLNVYRRSVLQYKTDVATEKLGFRTSSDTKAQLINNFQKLLREKVPKIYDKKTVEEMKSFMWSDQARQSGAGAARGFHDDDVMSTMLAFWDFDPQRIEEVQVARSRPIGRKRFQYS